MRTDIEQSNNSGGGISTNNHRHGTELHLTESPWQEQQ